MERKHFDRWFREDHPLRRTAAAIATTDAQAYPSFVTNENKLLDNCLANGQVGDAYQAPTDYSSALALAKWKYGPERSPLSAVEQHGFGDGRGAPSRGVALLFDPFVDVFLAAHMKNRDEIRPGCIVIILSDYYPLNAKPPAIPKDCKGDWGLQEMRSTLAGKSGKDPTTRALFDCLFGEGRWQGDQDRIEKTICEDRLLLWNFLPFFRGGEEAGGTSGLPTSGDWRFRCWEFLWMFLEATQASRAVFACSGAFLQLPRADCNRAILPLTSSQEHLQKPVREVGFEAPPTLDRFPALPTCVREAFRLYHPSAWRKSSAWRESRCHDGDALQKIIGQASAANATRG